MMMRYEWFSLDWLAMMLMISVLWFLTLTALLLITHRWTSGADDEQKEAGDVRSSYLHDELDRHRLVEIVAGIDEAYSGRLDRDPVCGVEISRDSAVAAEEYRGTMYYFCGGDCLEAFVRNPARHALAA
jgi:YHS domain-containing protein